ncbi:hypothetical protein POJ06DRAFT_289544 [Lipomyces tetrasporus]|uniref:Uncharacterized protein n=1 Tax=Lipomyces tetrasporus TaxID=54092 RepID=A0AAD7VTS2_9ASCO|nr:uncharacterized protein POJ06DRAFT_289544 [Lipomyces tetrasporus]KAJ8101019.1 hypothetical protein POJ06DRAFT_289544 [Lipomyces tetrasporus]
MLDLVRHSTASFDAIASVVNTTHGLCLLGRYVYNRSYDYTQKKGTPTAKLIEALQDECYLHRVEVAMDNILEALFFCKPQEIQMASLYEQMVIMDAVYKANRFRLPLVNVVTVDDNADCVALQQ